MKCSECERHIYLYEELTTEERQETDQHLATCSSCRQIAERATVTRHLIASQRSSMPPMPDAARMTRSILEAVSEKKKTKTTSWNTYFDAFITPLRYGMAGLSLFVIVSFLAEYRNDPRDPLLFKRYPETPKEAELNLASFHSAFLSARRNDPAAAAAFSQCVTNCANQEHIDCARCLKRFSHP